MKITVRIFSLPPYISTSWNNVIALHMKGGSLIVSLVDGDIIEIPGLKAELLELIFAAHAAFLEQDIAQDRSGKMPQVTPEPPFQFGISSMDNFGAAMQHNPAQANAPDIPHEILEKIGAIARIVAPNEPDALPHAEPHCNCMHCQVARAIAQSVQPNEPTQDEEPTVTDDELKFQQWVITQTGEKLFTVTNAIDAIETYNVFLGEPVGCTCGKPGCEHILAVLKS